MELTSLSVQYVRRLAQVSLKPARRQNLICGDNGSGKTSVLEAIHYLATARSFRTSRAGEVITHGHDALTVAGEFTAGDGTPYRVGVEKTRGATRLKLNGENLNVASKIARLIPVLTFNTESYLLLNGGPSNRRALLDRLLFHVEQDYLEVLKTYHRCLKQRNALLRARSSSGQIGSWDEQLAEAANRIDGWRSECVNRVNACLGDSPLSESIGELSFQYRRGWQAETPLITLLEKNRSRDMESGNTMAGPHRAELRIDIGGATAKSIVSRGQGKLIIGAIVSAQARYLGRYAEERPILLIDDLASELDREARRKAVESLLSTDAQCFFTAIESSDLPPELVGSSEMFHVEQGVVRAG